MSNDRLSWWRAGRLGMFIHWGLYAIPAGVWKGREVPGIGEWMMFWQKIPAAEYAGLAKQFNPVAFDADAVVRLAKDAGMTYLVITAKHHDGFAMFESACDAHNVVAATPYATDPMKALAAACLRHNIRLCFYYSQDQDWHHPGGAHNTWDFSEDEKDFGAYLEQKVKPQLKELLTQYGPVGLIWFDTPVSISREQSLALRAWVHELQPDCLVSGRVGHGVGDYQSLGDNQYPAGHLKGAWETPCTLNDTWGFKQNDHNWKSTDYLLRLMVKCAAKGVNYLLNIGPTAVGTVPRPSVTRLRQLGEWMAINGEAIYGSEASPFPTDFDWGAVTQRGNMLYLHLFHWPAGPVGLAGLRTAVCSARVLGAPECEVEVVQAHNPTTDRHELRLRLPRRKPVQRMAVLALELAGLPEVEQTLQQQPDGSILLPAHRGELRGGSRPLAIGMDGAVHGWTAKSVSLRWSFVIHQTGTFVVDVLTEMDRERPDWYGNHTAKVTVGRACASGTVGLKDLCWDERVNRKHQAMSQIGTLTIKRTGTVTLTLRLDAVDRQAKAGFTTCGIRLRLS